MQVPRKGTNSASSTATTNDDERVKIHAQGRDLLRKYGIDPGKSKFCSKQTLNQLATTLQVVYLKSWTREAAITELLAKHAEKQENPNVTQELDSLQDLDGLSNPSETSCTTTTVCY